MKDEKLVITLDTTKSNLTVSQEAELGRKFLEKFPNGFASWYETHHEVVSAITQSILLEEKEPEFKSKATTVSEEQGTGGLYELAEELTDKFEKLHEGREWDGEFFDEIEDFLQKELK